MRRPWLTGTAVVVLVYIASVGTAVLFKVGFDYEAAGATVMSLTVLLGFVALGYGLGWQGKGKLEDAKADQLESLGILGSSLNVGQDQITLTLGDENPPDDQPAGPPIWRQVGTCARHGVPAYRYLFSRLFGRCSCPPEDTPARTYFRQQIGKFTF